MFFGAFSGTGDGRAAVDEDRSRPGRPRPSRVGRHRENERDDTDRNVPEHTPRARAERRTRVGPSPTPARTTEA
ncbi:hypothetical protein B005_0648 [Nocardiopsis alba ATCC BAA-2165]|uniref:Uncharacterized protein n=1 Tax=Nocardiopsis alba (strain ATCC BAA-2165 / BE74) TaxID=1205910 RepID=J7L9X7_NOCAA|nr:hypothetical protein B005_0648 [Nocardiopsis alba ATCC BAA-2165]